MLNDKAPTLECLKLVEKMLIDGQVTLGKHSSDEYVEAAGIVFDNGLFFHRDISLDVVRGKIKELETQ